MGGARNSVKNLLNGHEIKIKLNFTWVTSRTWHVVSVSHGTWPRAAPDTKTLFFNFENSFFGFIPCPDRDTTTGTATSVGLHLRYRLETGDWWHYLGGAVSGSLGSFPGLSLVTLTTSMPLIGWLGPDLTLRSLLILKIPCLQSCPIDVDFIPIFLFLLSSHSKPNCACASQC